MVTDITNAIKDEEYIRTIDELNDAGLLEIAEQRMEHFDTNATISGEELYRDLGISKEDLERIGDVEIE